MIAFSVVMIENFVFVVLSQVFAVVALRSPSVCCCGCCCCLNNNY